MQSAQSDLQAEDKEIKKLSLIEEYESLTRKKEILSDPWPQLLSLLKKTGAKGTDAVSQSLVGGEIDHAVEIYWQQVSRLGEQANDQSALEKKLALSVEKYCEQYLKSVEVGSYIQYGTYPQTKSGTDRTPIEWLVLGRKENKALIISRYGLDAKAFNNESVGRTSWEECSLRSWLNNEFLKEAFTGDEQKLIAQTSIRNSSDRVWILPGGADTQDRIFLLSWNEANEFFCEDDDRMCRPTPYALEHGAEMQMDENVKESSQWWLRSLESGNWINVVFSSGSIGGESSKFIGYHKASYYVVRPALWLNLCRNINIRGVHKEKKKYDIYKFAEVVDIKTNPSAVKEGCLIRLGFYYQTQSKTDKSPVEWIVLSREENKVLVISRYGIERRPYHESEKKTNVKWEKCSLRKWLNNDFFDSAFSQEERKAILLSDVDNSKDQCNSKWRTVGGNNTQDHVFLLSYKEAKTMFRDGIARRCRSIELNACDKDTLSEEENEFNCGWWLRSPGEHQGEAASVYRNGHLCYSRRVSWSYYVRPALWLNLEDVNI